MDYEKILKGIMQIINTTEKSDIGFANICTYIGENCPELAESEDERISREITEFILTHRIDEPNDIEDTNSWLIWLEKQGEKKSINDLTKQEAMDIAVAKCFEQAEQKPILDVEILFGAKDSELEEVSYSIPNGCHAEIEDNKIVIKKGKQKQWKPSEKQMEALHELTLVGDISYIGQSQSLIELYNDLKKLIE